MHAHVARSCFDPDGWAAAVDLSRNVVLVKRPLHLHLVIGMHRARSGGGIQHKPCAAWPELDAARAGPKVPVRRRRSANLDIAGPRAAAQAAMHTLQLQVARAGLGLHIAVAAGLLGVDVARPGVYAKAPMKSGRMNVPGAGAELSILANAVVCYIA